MSIINLHLPSYIIVLKQQSDMKKNIYSIAMLLINYLILLHTYKGIYLSMWLLRYGDSNIPKV